MCSLIVTLLIIYLFVKRVKRPFISNQYLKSSVVHPLLDEEEREEGVSAEERHRMASDFALLIGRFDKVVVEVLLEVVLEVAVAELLVRLGVHRTNLFGKKLNYLLI